MDLAHFTADVMIYSAIKKLQYSNQIPRFEIPAIMLADANEFADISYGVHPICSYFRKEPGDVAEIVHSNIVTVDDTPINMIFRMILYTRSGYINFLYSDNYYTDYLVGYEG